MSNPVITILITLLAGIVIPLVVMRVLSKRLSVSGRKQLNYRGETVYRGLGIVWPLWAATLMVAHLAVNETSGTAPQFLIYLAKGAPLIIGTWIVGEIDDSLGSEEHRGFKGHFKSLSKGHITTGIVKIVVVGLLALYTSWVIAPKGVSTACYFTFVIVGALLIALSANLINLFDLRPGRALKAYLPFLFIAVACFALLPTNTFGTVDVLAIAIAALGPVIAIWRQDLGERGILGDAGANSMGAAGGFLLTGALPLPALIVAMLVVLALNLVSEKVSFTKIIASVPVLDRLDKLGR